MPEVRIQAEVLAAICEETRLSDKAVRAVLLAAARHRVELQSGQRELFGGSGAYVLVVDGPVAAGVPKRTRMAPKTPAPAVFVLAAEYRREALEVLGDHPDLDRLWERFVNWHRANAVARADWLAAWRNWCLSELERRRPGADDGRGLGADYLRGKGYGTDRGGRAGDADAGSVAGRWVDESAVHSVGGSPARVAFRRVRRGR